MSHGYHVYDAPAIGRPAFVGRDSLLRNLFDGLHQRRRFALVGGARTGRTSTLRHLTWLIHERWQRIPTASKVVPVYVDLAAVSRPDRLLPATLWRALHEQALAPTVRGQGGLPPLPKIDLAKVKHPWDELPKAMAALFEALRGTPAWCEWALLVDDADRLFEREFEAATPWLSGLAGDADPSRGDPASLVLAGGRALREALHDREAPLHKLRLTSLGALRVDEARAIVHVTQRELEDEACDLILATTGRHPWVLQRLLGELELLGADAIPEAVEKITPEVAELFGRMWRQLDFDRGVTYRGAYAAPEHALMQLLIDMGAPVDLTTAERELGISPLREYAELLEYLGLAERTLAGDTPRYRAHFDLWNVWYQERIVR